LDEGVGPECYLNVGVSEYVCYEVCLFHHICECIPFLSWGMFHLMCRVFGLLFVWCDRERVILHDVVDGVEFSFMFCLFEIVRV
jgi:hypothetical protein